MCSAIFGTLLVSGLIGFFPSSSHALCFPSKSQGTAQISFASSSSLLKVKPASKWDNLVEDEYEDYDDIPVAPDMQYVERNVVRAHQTFLAIRESGGKEMTNDIYVRDPESDVFWYVGKIARISDVSLEQCVARQWPMIEKHASHLRPLELFPKRGRLEIWVAPGDSEMEVAYNRPGLKMIKMSKEDPGGTVAKVKNIFIGFQGEVYQKGEDGFRTWRTDDGLPARPEINPGGETRPPTDEEYAQIQKELQGKDTDAIYEEQEGRKEKGEL